MRAVATIALYRWVLLKSDTFPVFSWCVKMDFRLLHLIDRDEIIGIAQDLINKAKLQGLEAIHIPVPEKKRFNG